MKVYFFTLGCKTNTYESNAIAQEFKKRGYEILDKKESADIYIINTCSVTNIAERKSRQMIRQARELNPNAIVVAIGCYVQVAKNEIANMEEVDLIVGNKQKNSVVEIVENYLKERIRKEYVSEISNECEYQEYKDITVTELNRAVLKIQDGCDRFCTYCIIPFARGRVRSRKVEKILDEAREIAKKGIKEIVLTGIHIASYGKDFTNEECTELRKKYNLPAEFEEYNISKDLESGGFRLIELLEELNKIDGIDKIRLGSIEPKLITEDFVERLAKIEKICPHFHLSLQSGCNEILKKMNRRYKVEDFMNSVKLLRNKFETVNFTTDIIVGFPGETAENHLETYKFLKEVNFYKIHVFKYSPKKGTAAEKFKDQVDGFEKERRSKEILRMSDITQYEINKSYIGKTVKVLIEEFDGTYYKGHTDNYMLVKVDSYKDLKNMTISAKIIAQQNLDLLGEVAYESN